MKRWIAHPAMLLLFVLLVGTVLGQRSRPTPHNSRPTSASTTASARVPSATPAVGEISAVERSLELITVLCALALVACVFAVPSILRKIKERRAAEKEAFLSYLHEDDKAEAAPRRRRSSLRHADPTPPTTPDPQREAWEAKWKKCLYTNVSGVSFKSDRNGLPRQEVILDCHDGEELLLVREPENPYDSNSILVVRQNGTEDIGRVPKEIARILSPQMDRGAVAAARITKITGLNPPKPTLGVNIVIGQNYAPYKKRSPKNTENPTGDQQ